VLPKPKADFSFTPDRPQGITQVIEFFDESEDAVSWQYIIDDEISIFQPNTTYQFDTLGDHKIQLIAIHPSGCPDTITKFLNIEPTSSFFLPNAFSPNGDGKNDSFKAKGTIELIRNFNIEIFARSGQMIYNSDDAAFEWNGQLNNQGNQMPLGVYVYQLSYTDPKNIDQSQQGYITLVR
jgi:gliding motility-associated-like protein